jgi:hypothetical protein
VTEQRHGRERRYRLVPARLGSVRDWIAHYERSGMTTSSIIRSSSPIGAEND